jgi:ABC-type glycerol-3-phosphate transport system substrate-binding protein
MKKLAVVFLLASLASLVFAGGGNQQQTQSNQVEITIWSMALAGTKTESIFKDHVIKGFNQKFPNVKVNFEMMTWEGGPEKLQIALGTGSTPDIYLDSTARTAALPATGLLVDVTDVIDAYKGKLSPALTKIGVINGRNYLVPHSAIGPTTIAVNTTLAKKMGVYNLLPADKQSWTFDDFYNFVKAANDAGKSQGIYGTAFWAGSASMDIAYYTLMMCNGGQILNSDHTAAMVNNPANVEAMEFLNRMVKDGLVAPGAASLKQEDVEGLMINSKIVAAISGEANRIYNMMKDMYNEGLIAESAEIVEYGYPTKSGKASDYVAGSWGANMFAIFKNKGDEAKIQAAKDFVKYYLDDTEAIILTSQSDNYLPPIVGITVPFDDPIIAENSNNLARWSGLYADSSFGILEPYWAEIRSKFYPELQAMFAGRQTAQEACNNFKAAVDVILANHKK